MPSYRRKPVMASWAAKTARSEPGQDKKSHLNAALFPPRLSSVASQEWHLSTSACGRPSVFVLMQIKTANPALIRVHGAAQIRGETVPVAVVETFWRTKLKRFCNRVIAIPSRVEYLSARKSVTLMQELRTALTELADDKGA
jgi:hypothetical protein